MKGWAGQGAGVQGVGLSVSSPMWSLSSEFPTVRWALMALPPSGSLVIPSSAWSGSNAHFSCWDRAVSGLSSRPRWVVVQGEDPAALDQTAREVVTRYQRLVPRTNVYSASSTFARVLSGHQAMHDLGKPRLRAEYDHALDVWQWVLRMAPMAGLAVQLAALFHDVAHLVPDARHWLEHGATDDPALDAAHAEQGAQMAAEVLAACGIDRTTCAQTASLIREHRARGSASNSVELELLANADALSFLSLSSATYADQHGVLGARQKVRDSVVRLSSPAICRLADICLREDIAGYLGEAVRAEARATIDRARVLGHK